MKARVLFFPFAVILSLVIFIWMTKPEWDELKNKKTELKKVQNEEMRASDNLERLKTSYVKYQGESDDSKKLVYNVLPSDDNNDDFIAEINKNAVQSGATVLSVGLGKTRVAASACPQPPPDSMEEVIYCPASKEVASASIQVVGDYLKVKEFIRKIDTQNRLAVPTTVAITGTEAVVAGEGDEATGSSTVQATITFNFFNKKKIESLALSKIPETDPVLNSLLSGSVSSGAIEKLREIISSELFIPVSVDGMGKEDLFS